MAEEMTEALTEELAYVTFHITAKDGSDVEMAVVDEFEYDGKHYVVAAVVKDDEIDDTGHYIYRAVIKDDDFEVQKITKEFEYNHVVDAYMSMQEEDSEE